VCEGLAVTTVRFVLRLVPLLAAILIDSISYTIVVPVLAAALVSDNPILMTGQGQSVRYIVYGVSLGRLRADDALYGAGPGRDIGPHRPASPSWSRA
jgi:hypothetical protein